MMNEINQTPNFTVQPETRALNITQDHTAEVRFLVASRTALRGEAHIMPVAVNGVRDPAAAAQFAPWLTLVGEREVAFDASGEAKPYTVRITVPDDADPGEYVFQLKVVDVAEPDETVGDSPDIAFQVIGPKPSLAGFVVAAVLALVLLAALAMWGVITVQNRTNLQMTVTRAGDRAPTWAKVRYEVEVENRRLSPVDGVRLRYELPDGVMGATAAVDGAITRHCDKLNRARTIICDLGTLGATTSRTIHFDLIPNPNWLAGMREVTTEDTHIVTRIRNFFFTEPEVRFERKLVGEVATVFQLSGHEINTKKSDNSSFTVERCLAFETRRNDELLRQEPCDKQNVWVSLEPAISESALNEIQHYTLRLWNEHTDHAVTDVVVRYELPEGLRYVGDSQQPLLHPPLERDDYTCSLEDYFTVACWLKAPLAPASTTIDDGVDLKEIVLQAASTGSGGIKNEVLMSGILSRTMHVTTTTGVSTTQIFTAVVQATSAVVETTNMNTALRFDGVDDWVELNYRPGKPTEFSVELWIHPFSNANGQAFVGAHTQDGQNVFLVGYWSENNDVSEGLLVNVFGADRVMVPIAEIQKHFPQDYHLTVTVKASDTTAYDVTVYLYNKETAETRAFGPHKFEFETELDLENLPGRNWVLGQDWDQGSPAPRSSDFFKGTMREVRIWDKVLSETQVRCVQNNRFYVEPEDGSLAHSEDLGADCITFSSRADDEERPVLLGYWRLDGPLDEARTAVADLARQPDDKSPRTASLWGDIGWGGIDPRFGTGLLFDGINDHVIGYPLTNTIAFSESVVISDTGMSGPVQQVVRGVDTPTAQETVAADRAAAQVSITTSLSTSITVPITAITNTIALSDSLMVSDSLAISGTGTSVTADRAAAQVSVAASSNTSPTLPVTAVTTSLATWFHVADGIPTERQWIAGVVEAGASLALMLDDSGHVIMVAGCGETVIQRQDNKPVPINRWVHYAGVIELTCTDLANATINLYRDGALVGQGKPDEVPRAAAPWAGCQPNVYIGDLPLTSNNDSRSEDGTGCLNRWPFKGRIDEVRIWNRALDHDKREVARWRNRPGEFFDELAYWSFAEGKGNQSSNQAGEQYHLQVVGPKWIDTNFDLAGQGAGP